MSVALRLSLSLFVLVACTALLGAVALSGLASLGERYRLAESQYRELRALYEVGFHAASIRTHLNSPEPDVRQIREHLAAAAGSARSAAALSLEADHRAWQVEELHRSLEQKLGGASTAFESSGSIESLRGDANRWLAGVAGTLPRLQDAIVANRERALAEHRSTLVFLAGVVGVTALIAAVAGVVLYRSLMRSIRALGHAAGRFAQGDFGHRAPDAGDREFRQLAREFNHMGRTIDSLHASMHAQIETKSKALIRSERLAGLGILAAGLAHEINNPLAIITGHAQLALRRTQGAAEAPARGAIEDCRETLAVITEEAFRCRDIVRQLLALAHPSEERPAIVRPAELVRRAVALVGPLQFARNRTVRVVEADPDARALACRGHAAQLLQVLINLLSNALEASAEGEAVEAVVDRGAGGVVIRIRDRGVGMDERAMRHAFDPFFTDKPRRGLTDRTESGGTGLGLFVSHSIVQRHGGRLLAHSDGPGRGSEFTIELPIASEREVAAKEEAAHAA